MSQDLGPGLPCFSTIEEIDERIARLGRMRIDILSRTNAPSMARIADVMKNPNRTVADFRPFFKKETLVEALTVVDQRPVPPSKPDMPLHQIPNGTMFTGAINHQKIRGTFIKRQDVVINLASDNVWRHVNDQNHQWFCADYQPVNGRIVIERNAK